MTTANNNTQKDRYMAQVITKELLAVLQKYEDIHTPSTEILYAATVTYTAAVISSLSKLPPPVNQTNFVKDLVLSLADYIYDTIREYKRETLEREQGR